MKWVSVHTWYRLKFKHPELNAGWVSVDQNKAAKVQAWAEGSMWIQLRSDPSWTDADINQIEFRPIRSNDHKTAPVGSLSFNTLS